MSFADVNQNTGPFLGQMIIPWLLESPLRSFVDTKRNQLSVRPAGQKTGPFLGHLVKDIKKTK